MSQIIVRNLKYRYPQTEQLALKGLDFTVEQGEFIGIVGRNGAGKTTLCAALTGLVPLFFKGAYGGSVQIDGIEVRKSKLSDLVRKVGMVFQNPETQITGARETVTEELAFGLENLGVSKPEMRRRIDHALRLLEIEHLRERNPFSLSGGQMQRVAIASSLVMQPEVMVLDEPTSQLDPRGTEEVFKAIKNLSAQGITIIMVEHKIEKIAEYADRILAMDQGRIIANGFPSEVFSTEGLGTHGIRPPVFTTICRALDIHSLPSGYYPVTLKEAANGVRHFDESD
jgi:ABC-type cobalt transport system, ATPase component